MDRSATAGQRPRVDSVDLIRGIVVVLMAIDHVRVYSGVPAGGPDPGIFLTRWVTHFCAPLFVLLAGTGAYFNGARHGAAALSRYLLTRGTALVLLELTLIRWLWSFRYAPGEFTLMGVIWMLGWCMILLAPLVRASARTVGLAGIAIIVLQPLFALPGALLRDTRFGWVWEFIYPAGLQPPEMINILYVIVPWVGVIMAGFGLGAVLTLEPARRRSVLLQLGLGMTALFLVLGIAAAWRAPRIDMPFLLQVLDQRKYPASVAFLCMTIGPALALMPAVEQARGWLARTMITFGRVPMFYYLLHIPLIHLSALLVQQLRDGAMRPGDFAIAPYTWLAEEHRWGLGLLYLVFVIDVALLYVACRWYEGVKARSTSALLRFL